MTSWTAIIRAQTWGSATNSGSDFQSKLPDEIRRQWEFQLSKFENEEGDQQVTVESFFGFLRSHVKSEEAMDNATFLKNHHLTKTQRPKGTTKKGQGL